MSYRYEGSVRIHEGGRQEKGKIPLIEQLRNLVERRGLQSLMVSQSRRGRIEV